MIGHVSEPSQDITCDILYIKQTVHKNLKELGGLGNM